MEKWTEKRVVIRWDSSRTPAAAAAGEGRGGKGRQGAARGMGRRLPWQQPISWYPADNATTATGTTTTTSSTILSGEEEEEEVKVHTLNAGWIDGHKKTQSKGNQRMNEWGSRDGWPLVVNELVMNAIWLECDGTVCDECSVRCWRGVIHQRRLICIWRAASFAYFHHPGWHDGGRRWCGVSITRRWLADNGRGSSP